MSQSWVKNQKTAVDGYNFPSKLHAAVYGTLRQMEAAGEISNIRCEVTLPIMGKLKWKADFVVFDEKKQVDQAHEAKGFMDKRFRAIMQAWDGAGPMDMVIWTGDYRRPSVTKVIRGKVNAHDCK